ncbi:MAG: mannose-1-phosphate guanylyltransferase/mannose-6-phosphate isomerase [Pseudomonadota bacterium]
MSDPLIIPALMCGGSGTRLWPLSRKSFPKQFADLVGEESLFQASAHRFEGPGFAPPLVVTAEDFRFIVVEQLSEAGIKEASILVEPAPRNTAAAGALAALAARAQDPEAFLLLSPADHVMGDPESFRAAVRKGLPAAAEGAIVTFGIRPTGPETGYGYLETAPDSDPDIAPGVRALSRFVEKPDPKTAEEMVADKRFLWNAGLFLARAADLVAAFERHAPEVIDAARAAFDAAETDLIFKRPAAEPWSRIPEISIDYAVMEKADKLAAVPYDGPWSDLGAWDAVYREGTPDDAGNVASGPTTAIDCSGTLLRSESADIELVGIGLKDIVAIAMGDAVMVADMGQAQNVKRAVEVMKARGARQATQLPVDHRPWGWFETLVLGARFQVKRIHVHPGAALSLQSHHHRSEHWIVVAGTAKVTVDDEVKLITENQSVYIPLGAVHRMENPGKVPMVLIEVQTGTYLGEDDIVRYEDIYARS